MPNKSGDIPAAHPSRLHDSAAAPGRSKSDPQRTVVGFVDRQSVPGRKARPAVDRILAVALEMSDHEYDRFQIRAVAVRAHVSPGTLYRHFQSKDNLLVACLHLWLTELVPIIRSELGQLTHPIERTRHSVARVTRGITERPLLAAAFVRSYLTANAGPSGSDPVRTALCALFAHAVGSHHSDPAHASELMTDIWSVNMPALLQGRIGLADLKTRIDCSLTAVGI